MRTWSFPLAMGLTVAGTIIPGVGLLAAGRRKLGLTALGAFTLLVGTTVYLATAGRRTVLHWTVQPDALTALAIVLPLLGVAWGAMTVLTYQSLRPRTNGTRRRLLSGCVVAALVLATLGPLVTAGRYALIQKSLIQDVFTSHVVETGATPVAARSAQSTGAGAKAAGPGSAAGPAHTATSTSTATPQAQPTQAATAAADPWAGKERINILLMGGDAGPDRIGVRPDTLILASIDTKTGATVLFSVPRNLMRIPFPRGSALAKAYPHGVYAGGGDQNEWLINSVYENVPAQKPGLLPGPHPGADATKMAIAGVLGIPVDYYVLVNLKGFESLIDALGGLTINVNQKVAIGGEATAGKKPHGWIKPGPNQHMDGWTALWFARGRYGASDWDRMIRQRCVVKAIIDQANPVNFLTRYEKLAETSKDILTTDIPAALLPALVDLSLKVKDASVTGVAFLRSVIRPSHPDYTLIRSLVQKALATSAEAPEPAQHEESLDTACAYTSKRS